MIADQAPRRASTVGSLTPDAPGRTEPYRHNADLATIRAAADALAIVLALLGALILRFRFHVLETKTGPIDLRAHVIASGLWLLGVLGAMASHRLYDEDTLIERRQEMVRVRRSLLEGIALVSTAVFLFEFVRVSRGWFGIAVGLTFVFVCAERAAVRSTTARLRKSGRLRRPAIVVSAKEASNAIPDNEFDVLACVEPSRLTGILQSHAEHSHAGSSSPVVIVDGRLARDDLWAVVLEAGRFGSAVFLRSQFRPLPSDRLATRTLDESTFVKVSPPRLKGMRAFEKRALDLIGSVLLLGLLAIPMLLIAVAVAASSGRPVFYRQQRVGLEGKLFRIWKFRTMNVSAERDTGPVWATAQDARRTGIGRVLRRFSLDELPQLFNVVKGEMSIVGPRPERPMFVARFSADHRWYGFRHRIKPGITGLAQVRGFRGDTPLEPRIEYDNDYIESWSLWLDVRTILRTGLEVVRGRNAQ